MAENATMPPKLANQYNAKSLQGVFNLALLQAYFTSYKELKLMMIWKQELREHLEFVNRTVHILSARRSYRYQRHLVYGLKQKFFFQSEMTILLLL